MRAAILLLLLLPAVLAAISCNQLARSPEGMQQQKTSCSTMLSKLPRPTVGNFCSHAFAKGVATGCSVALSSNAPCAAVLQLDEVDDSAGVACEKARGALPRPICFSSCTTGFNAGVRFGCQAVRDAGEGADAAAGLSAEAKQAAEEAAVEAQAAALEAAQQEVVDVVDV